MDLALCVGVGYMILDALLLCQRLSNLIHSHGCFLQLLLFDISLFLLLGFIYNSCWKSIFELIKSVNVCVMLRTVRVHRAHSALAVVIVIIEHFSPLLVTCSSCPFCCAWWIGSQGWGGGPQAFPFRPVQRPQEVCGGAEGKGTHVPTNHLRPFFRNFSVHLPPFSHWNLSSDR